MVRVRWNSWARRLALAVGSVPLFLLLSEGVLLLCGFGSPSNYFIPDDTPGFVRSNERFTWRFMAPELARQPVPVRIAEHKPAGTRRIFVLGSSAVQGFPFPAYSVGRFLASMYRLQTTDRVEVVNVALTAVNSHVVRLVAEECARYEPDVFLVYCGNNEVIGPFGPATVFSRFQRSLPRIRWQIRLGSTRTGQALQALWRRMNPPPRTWGGMEMFTKERIDAGDPRLGVVRDHFRGNLEAICRVAGEARASVVLCTVPVNLRDCPPFSPSSPMAGTTAGSLFLAGRYQEACDADGLRFRADSATQRIIREVAAANRASLVDLAALLDGGEDFLEHVHLSPEGTWKAAAAVFSTMTTHPAPSFEGCRQALALTDFDRVRIALSVLELRSRMPFTLQTDHVRDLDAARARLAGMRRELSGRMPAARAEYERALQSTPDDAFLLTAYAQFLGECGDHRGAVAAWRNVAGLWPHDMATRVQLARATATAGDPAAALAQLRRLAAGMPSVPVLHKSMGDQFVLMGDLQAAMHSYREAIALRPDYPDALANMASLLLRQGGPATEAESFLRKALEAGESDVADATLATLLLRTGRIAESLHHLERALLVHPDDARLHNNRGVALATVGRAEEARAEFETALRLDPAHAGARRALGQLPPRR